MRRFVMLAHDAPLNSDFSLNDLPGSAGRLDILCRCVSTGLCLSHGVRSDAEVTLVLQDALTIRINGKLVRNLHPDERSTAALLRKAIESRDRAIGHQEAESSPGIFISRRGVESVVSPSSATPPVFILDEGGEPITTQKNVEPATFVLADHYGFTDSDYARLRNISSQVISVSPQSLHADHTITIVHNWLDTDGYTTY